jgi:hypothetical protein
MNQRSLAPVFAAIALLLQTPASFATDIYKVTCKGKLHQSDVGTVAVLDLPAVREDETYIYHEAKFEDLVFELREHKGVFFYQPVLHLPGDQEITTTGYFSQDGTIKVESKTKLASGVIRTADIRCCRDCTFKDWQ